QTGFFQERLAHNVVFQDFIHGPLTGRQRVFDGVVPLGDGNLVSGVKQFLLHADIVDFDAVGAPQILDVPVAVPKHQLAVPAGNIGKPQRNVAGFPTPQSENVADEGNRIPASYRHEFAVDVKAHGVSSPSF